MSAAGGLGGEAGVGGDGGSGGVGGLGPWRDVQPVEVVNTLADEDDPCFTEDLLELYFNRDPTGGGTDIWVSVRASTSDAWGDPVPVDELNTLMEDGDQAVAPDGLSIWFSSDRDGESNIYVSTRMARGDAWGAPVAVAELNTSDGEEPCAVTGDGLRGVISRGLGGAPFDLFAITRNDVLDPWEAPTAILEVNSSAYDSDAWISPDGLSLFFTSMRDTGIAHILTTSRENIDDVWQAPVALDDFATGDLESDPWVSADLRFMMFAVGEFPNRDIYQATR